MAKSRTDADDDSGIRYDHPRDRQQQPQAAPPRRSSNPWRQLELGMSKQDIESLLGEPRSITKNKYFELWYYESTSHVEFNPSGRVAAWTEPS